MVRPWGKEWRQKLGRHSVDHVRRHANSVTGLDSMRSRIFDMHTQLPTAQLPNCKKTHLVPRPSCSLSVSKRTVKEPPACDSQTYCSSSLCLVVTITFSATRYAE